jgi:hypothetical protein
MKLYENLSLESVVYLDDNSIECTEIWRDLPDSEGMYQVSDLGRVKSFFHGKQKILKQWIDRGNYLCIGIYKNGKNNKISVHWLVFITYNEMVYTSKNMVVDHKNNCRHDNRNSNLQFISNRHNTSKDKINKTSKFTGVSWVKNKRHWTSSITHKSKTIFIGSFDTEEEASLYYQNAIKAIENNEEIILKRKSHSSKYKGVCYHKRDEKWISYIKVNNKQKQLGSFNTEDEAFNFLQDYLKSIDYGFPIKTNTKKKNIKI